MHFCVLPWFDLDVQGSQWHVGQIRDVLDAWPCTSRSRDLTSDLSYLGSYTMLETWIYFCFHGFLGQESQWHVGQIRVVDAWSCTTRSRDLTSDLSYRRALYMLETWFFVLPWFLGSRKSMTCRPDTWRPWRVTIVLQGHVTLQVTYLISGPIQYTC